MEPATIVVLVITAAFLAFCIWIERHSRSQERAQDSSRSAMIIRTLTEDRRSGTGRALMKRSSTKASSTSEAPEP